jgi:hypothetical protein
MEKAVRQIKHAVQELERAGRSSGIVWMKRSLLVLGAFGAASASAFVPPVFAALLMALSALGIGAAPTVTRAGVTSEFAYLQQLQAVFPDATSPAATQTA